MITQTPPETGSEDPLRDSGDAKPPRIVAVGRRLAARPWLTALVVIAIIVAIWLIVRASSTANAAPRYMTAPVRISNINASVEETGTVNPVNQVNVGTQVSGTVNELYVDYNSIVHKGQVLATLDPTSFQAAS